MYLWEAINTYVGRSVNFISEVLLANDGNGDYIKQWNLVTPTQPTQQQINTLLAQPSPLLTEHDSIGNYVTDVPSLSDATDDIAYVNSETTLYVKKNGVYVPMLIKLQTEIIQHIGTLPII